MRASAGLSRSEPDLGAFPGNAFEVINIQQQQAAFEEGWPQAKWECALYSYFRPLNSNKAELPRSFL